MKKFLIYLLIGLGLEALSSTFGMVRHIESLFFVWGVLYLGMFLIVFARVDTTTYSFRYKKSFAQAQNTEDIIKNRKRMNETGAFPSLLLFLFIMLILNSIGFMILKP